MVELSCGSEMANQISYSQFACIGTGLSAVALGATLQRWYGITDIQFFDRHPDCGGTWWINSYPGCACDVPSALYSFSFELNPLWTKLMPSNTEIHAYHAGIVKKYSLREHMNFSTEVLKCVWDDETSTWTLNLENVITGHRFIHTAQILFSASGQLVEPRPCDIPGYDIFQGPIFHSARWNHDVSLKDKRVVVIGNGCTAAQIVPAILPQVKHLTQMIRSKHWVFPAHNFTYSFILQWIFKYVPFAMLLHRFHIFLIAENDFRLFPMTKAAARFRERRRNQVENYMRQTAPERYHDLLIPDFDIGCKRRIFDCGYLASLHSENLTLTDDKIIKIVADGIETQNGFIPADVIVLATGFKTNSFVNGINIVGRNEELLEEHWNRYPGPEAYNCSVMSGFPNFFLLLGPNAATGHTSATMAAENSINYALRVLKPVIDGRANQVEVKQEAEHAYVTRVQEALRNRVWNAGCNSWYINSKQWNAMSYPWTQAHYWYRSLFPVWSDWQIW